MKNPFLKFAAFILTSLLIILIVCYANNRKVPPIIEAPFINGVQDAVDFPIQDAHPVFSPVIVDPAEIINYPKEDWRNPNYEVFSWDVFANTAPILIFDYADYDIQNRMLKRLAFFVEKVGFRGRLAFDSEIAHLHGWNAHNYRAEDLARFFDTARKQNFPLLDEEWELEKILLDLKIIRMESGSIVSGTGAVISIARESANNLRWRFLAHEGFHGLYFVDEDFRVFCRKRWEQLPISAKKFIIAYFDHQQYDTSDEYLLINEFMGHIMQQPLTQVADYFGRNLPSRLENTRRASELPQKDTATGNWPELANAFTQEAQAISEYVGDRWGFTAGRAWQAR